MAELRFGAIAVVGFHTGRNAKALVRETRIPAGAPAADGVKMTESSCSFSPRVRETAAHYCSLAKQRRGQLVGSRGMKIRQAGIAGPVAY